MPALSPQIDLIEELMFRCWARRNYLPPELRETTWHPVILEEMACRDQELIEQEREESRLNRLVGHTYVPLVPTVTHYVHPAHSEMREPHFLTLANSSTNEFTNSIYAGGIYDFAW